MASQPHIYSPILVNSHVSSPTNCIEDQWLLTKVKQLEITDNQEQWKSKQRSDPTVYTKLPR